MARAPASLSSGTDPFGRRWHLTVGLVGSTIAAMNPACVQSSGRTVRIPRAFACSLALLVSSSALAQAQRNPQQGDRLPIDLQESVLNVDQLKTEIERANKQLETLNAKMPNFDRPMAAPLAAWVALGIVGGIFAVTWGIVSAFREQARAKEAEADRSRKTEAEIAEQARMIEAAVNARIKLLIDLMREADRARTGAQPVDFVANAAQIAEALSRGIARGMDSKGSSTA